MTHRDPILDQLELSTRTAIKQFSQKDKSFEQALDEYEELLQLATGSLESKNHNVPLFQEIIYSYSVINFCKAAGLYRYNVTTWEAVMLVGAPHQIKLLAGTLPLRPFPGLHESEFSDDRNLVHRADNTVFVINSVPWCISSLSSSAMYSIESAKSFARLIEGLLKGTADLNNRRPYRPYAENTRAFNDFVIRSLSEGKPVHCVVFIFGSLIDYFSLLGSRKIVEIHEELERQVRDWYQGHYLFPLTGKMLIVADNDEAIAAIPESRTFKYHDVIIACTLVKYYFDGKGSLQDFWEELYLKVN